MDHFNCLGDVEIGAKVKHYRKLRNITQAQLARWVGVSTGVISRLENHNSIPAADIMLSIAKHLEIPPIYIFRGSEYTFFLNEFIPEQTIVHPDYGFKNFSITRLSCDFSLNPNEYISVRADGKLYLACKNISEDCLRFLCVDENFKCVLCVREENGYIKETDGKLLPNDSVIAGILDDITDYSTTVTI